MPGIKTQDRSAISFSRVNSLIEPCPAAKVDLTVFENLTEKQQFVNDQNDGIGLSKALDNFVDNVICNYEHRDTKGLDIISLIIRDIDNGIGYKSGYKIQGMHDTTSIIYRNSLILFTDGYLEFSPSTGNMGYYFGFHEIKRIRSYCEEHGLNPEEALKKNSSLGIRANAKEQNSLIDLYLLETYDRGINRQNGTIKNSGPLSDNNILKAVWTSWAQRSGFNSLTWRETIPKQNVTKQYIESLLHAPPKPFE